MSKQTKNILIVAVIFTILYLLFSSKAKAQTNVPATTGTTSKIPNGVIDVGDLEEITEDQYYNK